MNLVATKRSTTITPRRGMALIKCDPKKDVSAGGIHIPESAREEFKGAETYATIEAVGAPELMPSGCEAPIDWAVGDYVLVRPSSVLLLFEEDGSQFGLVGFGALMAKVEQQQTSDFQKTATE